MEKIETKQIREKPYSLDYKGFWNNLNPKPKGDYIKIFVSDWNKNYFGFYAYINVANYKQDIKAINDLITILNFRDGDVYIELINLPKKDAFNDKGDYPTPLGKFYHKLYEIGKFSHSEVLNPRYWEGFLKDNEKFLEMSKQELFNAYY